MGYTHTPLFYFAVLGSRRPPSTPWLLLCGADDSDLGCWEIVSPQFYSFFHRTRTRNIHKGRRKKNHQLEPATREGCGGRRRATKEKKQEGNPQWKGEGWELFVDFCYGPKFGFYHVCVRIRKQRNTTVKVSNVRNLILRPLRLTPEGPPNRLHLLRHFQCVAVPGTQQIDSSGTSHAPRVDGDYLVGILVYCREACCWCFSTSRSDGL